MSITNGQPITPSDFPAVSAGAGDAGKSVKLGSDGQLDRTFLQKHVKFGGTGADGALSIASGTTTLDLGGAAIFIKNYTSIAITGTGKLAFSNPHANGTIIILKSIGNVTITSSTNPAIDLRSMGGVLGSGGGATVSGTAGTSGAGSPVFCGGGGGGTASTTSLGGSAGTSIGLSGIFVKGIFLACGGGGGGGGGGHSSDQNGGGGGGGGGAGAFGTAGGAGSTKSTSTGGDGGRGGGALYIECAGALNITSTINASGSNGSNAGDAGSGGGGGGGGGSIIILYGTLTANSGTYTIAGGAGGTVGDGTGGVGGAGMSYVAANTEFA